MSNWCNNFLEITTKEKPEWVDAESIWDDALQLPNDDHCAFWRGIECIKWQWFWKTTMYFQTKWSPPIEFYQGLLKDCLSIYADYSESGSEIYGKFDENWHEECSWPDTFYSETIDMTIHRTKPSQLFRDVVQDEYCLFEDYLKEMYDAIIPNTNELAIENEIQECAEQLNVNLEDQQWVECVANNMPDEMLNHVPAPIIS